MRIVFAGTPEFALPTLQCLLDSRHEVIATYTQPDKPAGRGRVLTPTPVKSLALQHQIPVYQPLSLKSSEAQRQLNDLSADLMVVIAYGLILPQAVLSMPRYGCLNVHASLLPKWRGAAPIQRAILAGDKQTGVTIMQMDAGLDTGTMLEKFRCAIEPDDTSQSLHEKLARLGPEALLKVLDDLERGRLQPETQQDALACYATKLTKQEARIDWSESATKIERRIRAYYPWPVAHACIKQHSVKLFRASVIAGAHHASSGAIVACDKQGITVACGRDMLRLEVMQFPGGKKLTAHEVLNAKSSWFEPGMHFE